MQRENFMNADNWGQQSIQIVMDERIKGNVVFPFKVFHMKIFNLAEL